jgi:hypothetical protein
MNQAVMTFATAAARDAALTVPTEGMTAYLQDTNVQTTYDGAAWVISANIAAWTTWTPTYTGISVGNGTASAHYQQIGKTVRFRLAFALGTTSGVAAAGNQFTLPIAPLVNAAGSAIYYDASATAIYAGSAWMQTDNHCSLGAATGSLTNTVPFTWASTDQLIVSGTYDVA